MKNIQESNQDDESLTNKIIDNQSEIQSEKNFSQKNNIKANIKNVREMATNSNLKINFNSDASFNQSNISNNFAIKMNSDGNNKLI